MSRRIRLEQSDIRSATCAACGRDDAGLIRIALRGSAADDTAWVCPDPAECRQRAQQASAHLKPEGSGADEDSGQRPPDGSRAVNGVVRPGVVRGEWEPAGSPHNN